MNLNITLTVLVAIFSDLVQSEWQSCPNTTGVVCPSSWDYHGGYCFRVFNESSLDWNSASSSCQAMYTDEQDQSGTRAELAAVKGSNMNAFLFTLSQVKNIHVSIIEPLMDFVAERHICIFVNFRYLRLRLLKFILLSEFSGIARQ